MTSSPLAEIRALIEGLESAGDCAHVLVWAQGRMIELHGWEAAILATEALKCPKCKRHYTSPRGLAKHNCKPKVKGR